MWVGQCFFEVSSFFYAHYNGSILFGRTPCSHGVQFCLVSLPCFFFFVHVWWMPYFVLTCMHMLLGVRMNTCWKLWTLSLCTMFGEFELPFLVSSGRWLCMVEMLSSCMKLDWIVDLMNFLAIAEPWSLWKGFGSWPFRPWPYLGCGVNVYSFWPLTKPWWCYFNDVFGHGPNLILEWLAFMLPSWSFHVVLLNCLNLSKLGTYWNSLAEFPWLLGLIRPCWTPPR